MLYAVLKPVARAVLRAAFGYRVVGSENVPAEGPAILAANHMSFLDPPAVGAAIPRPIHFMAKAELFRVPLLGGLIRRLNAHPVDRSGSDAPAMRMALRLLGHGEALLVFPEGTRGEEGTLRPAHAGAGMLAALSRAPVVPVHIEGTGRAWPRGAKLPRRARITVTYGAPIRFTRDRGKARYQTISDEIMAAIGRLRANGGPHSAFDPRARTTPGPVPVGQIQ